MQMILVTAGSDWDVVTRTRPLQKGFWVMYTYNPGGIRAVWVWVPSYRRASSLREGLNRSDPLINAQVYAIRGDPQGTAVYLCID